MEPPGGALGWSLPKPVLTIGVRGNVVGLGVCFSCVSFSVDR